MKNFHIFDGVIPLTHFGVVNQMWCVCAMLCNTGITFLFLVTPQIHTGEHMPIIFYNNHLPVNYSSINGAS